MAISLIDKIKQKNNQDFKLVDAIDIHGRITGWQNATKKIFVDVASISLTGYSTTDYFIVQDASGIWGQFIGKDIYGRDVVAVDNGIYVLGESIVGEAFPILLVTAPEHGMVILDMLNRALKYYDHGITTWTALTTGSGTVTGKTLQHEGFIVVDTAGSVDQNYDPVTKQLTISYEIKAGDTVKIFVNGIKYTDAGVGPDYEAVAGREYLVWNDGNAGFDLESGDEIIIEIYN